MKTETIKDFQIVKYVNSGKTELKCSVTKGENYCGILEVFEYTENSGKVKLWKETANIMRLNAEDALEDARLLMIDTLETNYSASMFPLTMKALYPTQ